MKVKELREKKGMTQVDLAVKAGISLATVQKHEQGYDRLSNRIKRTIAKCLDVNPAELFPEAIAKWEKTPGPSAREKQFGEELKILYNDLMTRADSQEKELIADIDNFCGFQEIMFLIKKYKIQLPKGIL